MHELSLIRAMLNLTEQELARENLTGKVRSITLKVGRLSGANPEALRFAFETASIRTKLADARLVIEECKAGYFCEDCGSSGELEELAFSCPVCDSENIKIEGGRELLLKSIEVEE